MRYCGQFVYYSNINHLTCRCWGSIYHNGYEFIFQNHGHAYVGQDIYSVGSSSENVAGNNLFVRQRLGDCSIYPYRIALANFDDFTIGHGSKPPSFFPSIAPSRDPSSTEPSYSPSKSLSPTTDAPSLTPSWMQQVKTGGTREYACQHFGCEIVHEDADWRGGSFSVGIKGDFNSNSEYANIYVNEKYVSRCNGRYDCRSYYDSCGSFNAPAGPLRIRVKASSSVNRCTPIMGVKISWHGSFETVYGKSVPTVNPTLYPVVSPTIDPSVSGSYENLGVGFCTGDINLPFIKMPNTYEGSENSDNECRNLCNQNVECLGYNYQSNRRYCYLWAAEGTFFASGTPTGYTHVTHAGSGTRITAAYYEGSSDTQCMRKRIDYSLVSDIGGGAGNMCTQNSWSVTCAIAGHMAPTMSKGACDYSTFKKHCSSMDHMTDMSAVGCGTQTTSLYYPDCTVCEAAGGICVDSPGQSSGGSGGDSGSSEEVQFESEKSEVLEEVLLEKPTLNVIMAALAMVGLFAFISTLNKVICKRSEYQPVIEEQEI